VAGREFIERMNLLLFGQNWRKQQAEDQAREAAIERGEPVECPTCKHVGVMPTKAEREAEKVGRLLPASSCPSQKPRPHS